jgi:hypothetical protein
MILDAINGKDEDMPYNYDAIINCLFDTCNKSIISVMKNNFDLYFNIINNINDLNNKNEDKTNLKEDRKILEQKIAGEVSDLKVLYEEQLQIIQNRMAFFANNKYDVKELSNLTDTVHNLEQKIILIQNMFKSNYDRKLGNNIECLDETEKQIKHLLIIIEKQKQRLLLGVSRLNNIGQNNFNHINEGNEQLFSDLKGIYQTREECLDDVSSLSSIMTLNIVAKEIQLLKEGQVSALVFSNDVINDNIDMAIHTKTINNIKIKQNYLRLQQLYLSLLSQLNKSNKNVDVMVLKHLKIIDYCYDILCRRIDGSITSDELSNYHNMLTLLKQNNNGIHSKEAAFKSLINTMIDMPVKCFEKQDNMEDKKRINLI